MANTHMAVIEHLDGRLTHVAGGDEAWVREKLAQWERTHTMSFYDTPMVLQIIEPNPEG